MLRGARRRRAGDGRGGFAAARIGERMPAVLPQGEAEEMRRRNGELEGELRRSREREAAAMQELELTRERLRATEAAEERLCAQLGEAEADAVEQARAYLLQIQSLKDRLSGEQLLPGHPRP